MIWSRTYRPTAPRRHLRRLVAAPLVLLLAMVMTGCDFRHDQVQGGGTTATLVVSEVWANSVEADAVHPRLVSLQQAIKRLRQDTGTGWVGRQDDVTGYLAQLSGGSWPGSPTEFMDAFGEDLFGVASASLSLGDADTETVHGMSSVRATQVVAGNVPVLDGTLQFTSRVGSGSAPDRLTEVRGRVFPGLEVATQPQIAAERAREIAEEKSGGRAEGPAELVVVPQGEGVLAWAVTVLTGPDGSTGAGRYFIDSTTGDVVGVRRVSAELDAPIPWADVASSYLAGARGPRAVTPHIRGLRHEEPDPNSVEVTGVDATGKEITAHGLRTPGGVELTDTTTPAYDAATRRGVVTTYDASGITNESRLPGRLVVSPDTRIRDADSIAAQAYSRDVIDYYASLGRNSWDDKGGSAISSVHFGPADYCNAFFSAALNPPQMVYANPCTEEGSVVTSSFVGIDITGHEMTHGVTDSTAGLIYGGQSGALNESFSDYFGNVVGNQVNGTDSVSLGEELCDGITATDNHWCPENPDGTHSLRYMLNGNDFDDYLRVLNPGLRLRILGMAVQDQGGVHYNSAIWNNALWSIRSQLANIEGKPGNDSELAHAFDRVVYAALTTRLGPTSGFIDARDAVEQVIIDSQLDPVVLRVAREVFDANKICVGCPTVGQLAGDTVAATPQAQLHPSVSGDLVAWLDMSAGDYVGSSASLRLGGSSSTSGSGDIGDVALAGEAVVALDVADRVIRYDDQGATQLEGGRGDLITRGLAGSDAGAAWAPTTARLSFVDPTGAVTSADVPGLAADKVIAVGTGGGTVGAGTEGGKVFMWKPGGTVTQVGTMSGAVVSVAPYGDNVLAVSCVQEIPGQSVPTCAAKLFSGDGRSFKVSDSATVLGAAMSEEYAVWPEEIGKVSAGVAPGGTKYPETDLYLLSLKTGKIYDLLPEQGQQGFPALSGRRLVWQDSTFGGDDILTAELPPGL